MEGGRRECERGREGWRGKVKGKGGREIKKEEEWMTRGREGGRERGR